jgi:hypothetical protein
MAWSFLTYSSIANGAATAAVDTTGATDIFLMTGFDSGATVSDSKGNTWTGLTTTTVGGGSGRLYYCHNPTVGAGHTFSISLVYCAVFMMAFSGGAASPFDQQSGGSTSSATSLQAPSVTPTQNDELLIAGLSLGAGTSLATIDSGYTVVDRISGIGGIQYGGAFAYFIQTTAGAKQPTYSWTGTGSAVMCNATFKSAGGGGGPVPMIGGRYRLLTPGVQVFSGGRGG